MRLHSVLIVLVLGLLAACNNANNSDSGSNNTASGTSKIPKGALAYVNTDSLLSQYDYYKDLKDDFMAKKEQAEAQLLERRKQFGATYQSVDKRAKAGLLSQKDIEAAQADLQSKEQDILRYEQDLTAGFMEQERMINDSIYKAITSYIDQYNKTKGYQMIFGYQAGVGILYADKSMDITPEILKGINEEYKKKKGNSSTTK